MVVVGRECGGERSGTKFKKKSDEGSPPTPKASCGLPPKGVVEIDDTPCDVVRSFDDEFQDGYGRHGYVISPR